MPLLDTLNPFLAKWTTQYRRSPLPAFFAWWKAELVACLPEKWQAWLQDRREVWLASIDGNELLLHREGQAEPLARLDLGERPEVLRSELLRRLGRGHNPDRLLILAVPQAHVLLRSLQFPPAVEQNLRQVLTFEMDRQTPFKADQVYFDYHADLAANGKQLKVDLALAPKPGLDALLERARALELSLDGVDVLDTVDGPPRRRGFNLLPDTLRGRRSNPQRRLNLILLGIAIVLFVLVIQQSLANRQAALEAMRDNVEQARAEAHAVVALRGQLNLAVEGASYLNEKKRAEPSLLRVVGDLSARLPDDTFLERLTFRGGNLEVVGQSTEATRLIALLQQSNTLAGPAFTGQITPDARTRKERFNLSARYDLRPGEIVPEAPPEPALDPDAEADADADADAEAEAGEGEADAADGDQDQDGADGANDNGEGTADADSAASR